MKKEILRIGILIAVIVNFALPGYPSWVEAQMLEVKTYHGIQYVNGGIGFDERKELSKVRKDYNLNVLFAIKSGDYLADIKVVIKDRAGKTIFKIISEGPWLLVNLPEGSYTVDATLSEKTLHKVVDIHKKDRRGLNFYWE